MVPRLREARRLHRVSGRVSENGLPGGMRLSRCPTQGQKLFHVVQPWFRTWVRCPGLEAGPGLPSIPAMAIPGQNFRVPEQGQTIEEYRIIIFFEKSIPEIGHDFKGLFGLQPG